MKLPEIIIDKLIEEKSSPRFDQTIEINGHTYHYYINNSILFTQMCRAYYLLAKELGVPSAEYDYVRKNGINILLSKRICEPEEELIELSDLPEDLRECNYTRDYYDYIQLWEKVINTFPFENKEQALKDLYKQWFFGLLVFDDDKQTSVVKGSNGLCRIGEQFDYGGVYMMQDGHQLDIDIYYDKEEFEKFCLDWIASGEKPYYTTEILNAEVDELINKEVFEDIAWREGCDETLLKIIPHLDTEFINKCFSTNIIDVLNKDTEHEYSDNFRKVIFCMFETSKDMLKEKVSNLPHEMKQTESTKK